VLIKSPPIINYTYQHFHLSYQQLNNNFKLRLVCECNSVYISELLWGMIMLSGKILTPKQVAEVLNVGYRLVLNLIKERKIIYFKVGNKYRVHESDLENFVKEAKIDKWEIG